MTSCRLGQQLCDVAIVVRLNGSQPLRLAAKIDVRHVPFKDNGLSEVMAGRIDYYFIPLAAAASALGSGKLTVLAVSSLKRSPLLPDVPSIGEFVSGYEASNVNGIGVPGKTSDEVVMKLNGEINAILGDPATKARFAQLGGAPMIGSSLDYKAFLIAETDKWAKVVKAADDMYQDVNNIER